MWTDQLSVARSTFDVPLNFDNTHTHIHRKALTPSSSQLWIRSRHSCFPFPGVGPAPCLGRRTFNRACPPQLGPSYPGSNFWPLSACCRLPEAIDRDWLWCGLAAHTDLLAAAALVPPSLAAMMLSGSPGADRATGRGGGVDPPR